MHFLLQNEKENGILLFQFPSNGKAHVHSINSHVDFADDLVSIPFKRESTCALLPDCPEVEVQEKGFNSLQTGKHMCTLSPTSS